MPLNFNPQVLVNLSPTRQVQWPLLQALRLWRTWCPYWSLLHVFLLHVFRTYGSNKQPQHGTLDLIKVSPGLIHLAWFFLSTNSLFALLPISEYLFFCSLAIMLLHFLFYFTDDEHDVPHRNVLFPHIQTETVPLNGLICQHTTQSRALG